MHKANLIGLTVAILVRICHPIETLSLMVLYFLTEHQNLHYLKLKKRMSILILKHKGLIVSMNSVF